MRLLLEVYGQLFNFVRSVLYDDLSAIIYVLQMGRNELKYDFNCQNHAFFPRIYLSILHKYSSTGLKHRRPAKFHGQKC